MQPGAHQPGARPNSRPPMRHAGPGRTPVAAQTPHRHAPQPRNRLRDSPSGEPGRRGRDARRRGSGHIGRCWHLSLSSRAPPRRTNDSPTARPDCWSPDPRLRNSALGRSLRRGQTYSSGWDNIEVRTSDSCPLWTMGYDENPAATLRGQSCTWAVKGGTSMSLNMSAVHTDMVVPAQFPTRPTIPRSAAPTRRPQRPHRWA